MCTLNLASKKSRQKIAKMNDQQQNSRGGQTAAANANSNQTAFAKSMDDWLNSTENNISNSNNNGNNIYRTPTANSNNENHNHNHNNNMNNMNNMNNNNNNNNGNDVNYQQKHLDDWLNATLKDSPKTFSISSTEFPDGPIRNAHINGIGSMVLMPPINSMRTMPEFQNQSNYMYTNNIESSPYFQATNFVPTAAGLKMQSHHSDFTSLPPAVNLNADTNRSSSQNDLLDGLDNRRFSDPCLAANSEDETQQNTRDKINSKNQSDNNKLLATLIKQINILHETNSRICRNLNDTKIEIETLKHAPNWDFRNRRDSLSGFSTHSQPMGYTFGTHSPAPTYHSGMYTPGMMTDVVREVKEGARIREEALLSRVRALVEERSWTMNEANLKLMRDFEEMKIQINQLKADRLDTKAHVSKLEEEVKTLKTLCAHLINAGPTNHSLSMNIGTQSTPINASDNIINRQNSTSNHLLKQKRRSLCLNYENVIPDFNNDMLRPIQQTFNDMLIKDENTNFNRNPNEQYANADNENHDLTIIQMEKDNIDLRRELQDTRASKKQADKKIQDLEQRLKAFQNKSMANATDNIVTISTGHSSSTRLNNGNNNNDEFHGKMKFAPSVPIKTPKVMTTSNGTSTISLTGPVTDL